MSLRVGGSPVRSKLTRRISRSRSALGEGVNFSLSSFASTNRSISLAGQRAFFTDGSFGTSIELNDQCRLQVAPWSIQRLRASIWAAVSLRFDLGGGMISSGSLLVILLIN